MQYSNTQLFIDGRWQDATDGGTLPVVNPATGLEIGKVAHSQQPDWDRALQASVKGFETWQNMTAVARATIMRRAAVLLRERADEIAHLLTLEQGKILAEAKGETLAAADIIEWFADQGLRIYGRIVPSRANLSHRQMVLYDPVGPVAAFTPWNFPINQVVRKVGAALSAGCSMIVKGPEETPASPAQLIAAFADAGLPPGVLGLIYGTPADISNYLIAHPAIRKVTFTGSTAVGKLLAAQAGRYMKRVTMELGGHAPVIVAPDADLAMAIKQSAATKFRNAGQVCISPTRFLVHESVYQEFTQGFTQYAKALKVGDGLGQGIQMGPLANSRRLSAMNDFIEDATSKGATLNCGGHRIGEIGNFWAPTVLSDVADQSRVLHEEPFGPLAVILKYSTLEQAIEQANSLPYGLAGYAYTKSLKNADLLARKVQVGMMWINSGPITSAELPFGGLKDSGYGSEGGQEALDAYLNVRAVSIMNV